jgi:6-phosphogluconolactonase
MAEHFVRRAAEAITASGRFAIALSGGSTPRGLYALLATDAFARRVDWSRVHVFFGDERCLPPDHPDSNARMARETLLDRVPVPATSIHRLRGEDDPEHAASEYERTLQAFFGQGGPGYSAPAAGFDLILLGMGENGHTASLFPRLPAVSETAHWVMAQYVAEVASWRITLTPVVINAAAEVIFLVSGAEKAAMLHQVLVGPVQPEVLPAQAIKPIRGRLIWMVDEAAAALTSES